MPFVAPTIRSTGDLITAAIWNTDVIGNIVALYSGAMSVTGQTTGDLLAASSATQMTRLAPGVAGSMLRSAGPGAAPVFSTDGSALTALNAANITSGTMQVARLATGTPTATTTLLGNGTWGNVGIRSVQQIQITIATGSTSQTGAISSVDASKSYVILRSSLSQDPGRQIWVTLTSGTLVTASKNQTTSSVAVDCSVIEHY